MLLRKTMKGLNSMKVRKEEGSNNCVELQMNCNWNYHVCLSDGRMTEMQSNFFY